MGGDDEDVVSAIGRADDGITAGGQGVDVSAGVGRADFQAGRLGEQARCGDRADIERAALEICKCTSRDGVDLGGGQIQADALSRCQGNETGDGGRAVAQYDTAAGGYG